MAERWIDNPLLKVGPYQGPTGEGIAKLYKSFGSALEGALERSKKRRATERPKGKAAQREQLSDNILMSMMPSMGINPELFGRPRELREPFTVPAATGQVVVPPDTPAILRDPATGLTGQHAYSPNAPIAAGTPTSGYPDVVRQPPATGMTYPPSQFFGGPTAATGQTIPSVQYTPSQRITGPDHPPPGYQLPQGLPFVEQFTEPFTNPKNPPRKYIVDPVLEAADRYRKSLITPDTDPELEVTPGSATDPGATAVPPPDVGERRVYPPRSTVTRPEPGGTDVPPFARLPKPGEVLPPAPGTEETPPVSPEPSTALPEFPELPSAADLPGVSTESSTGALSADEYIEYVKSKYPDLDFSNPKQAEADANARRDLDRTSLLATLAFAGGMVAGAGPAWVGMGKGFMQAGEAYDAGFQKYQNALQDSADRYGEQLKAKQAYDVSMTTAGLELYSKTAAEDRADRRELAKWRLDRQWDYTKLGIEHQRDQRKLAHEDINKFFDRDFDQAKPATDQTTADPEEEARKAKYRAASQKAREESLRLGYIVPTQNYVTGMADQ